MTICVGDRINIVASLLGGRTDKATDIAQWLISGYRDLAHSIPFETLEATANILLPVSSQGQYPPNNTFNYPSDARAIKSITIGVPAVNPTSFRPLYPRNAAILDRYSSVAPGVPAIWAPFNNTVIFAQPADQAYPVIVRYWQTVQVNATDPNDTQILLPDDWIEIVDYEAQMRGWIDLQEPEKAAAIRLLLYGDPLKPGKPGLIKIRLTRIQAESGTANYGLRPRKTRYTWVR